MTHNPLGSKAPHVLVAAALIFVLAGVLAVRVVARATVPARSAPAPAANIPVPPPASVPGPQTIDIETLAVPCWGCLGGDKWPVRFRTDLDRLAPLGTGTANAAVWFKDFAKPGGSRHAEADAAMARRGEGGALPPDDPLLLEAEPWCNQATMRFYPDLLPLKGWTTPVPNLLLALTFARTWAARGRETAEPAKAMEDFRRTIRLGRLLRQDDVTVIQDIVGLACINLGAQGMYDLAIKQGDAKLALVTAVVLGEHSAQRLMTAERLTETDLTPYFRKGMFGRATLELPDAKLDDLVTVASGGNDRRFRAEAILRLNIVRFLGTRAQQTKALSVLNAITAGGDPLLAAMAAWSRDTRPNRKAL